MGLPTTGVDGRWTVFLDRDGVLNRRVVGDYVRSPDQLEVLDGVAESIAVLTGWGCRTVVVSNQAGVGKGLMTAAEVDAIHDRLVSELARFGGRLDAIFVCPHRREERCSCRKPATGLAEQAQQRFPDLDLAASVMIGDSDGDLGFAARLGIPSILVTGTGGEFSADASPTARASSLRDAVALLGGDSSSSPVDDPH